MRLAAIEARLGIAPSDPRRPEPAGPGPGASPPAAPPASRIPSESALGGTWLARAGMAALLTGLLFLAKHSWDAGWLGPEARVLSVFLASALLLAAGEASTRRAWSRYRNIEQPPVAEAYRSGKAVSVELPEGTGRESGRFGDDLRVVDQEGREVPFLLRTDRGRPGIVPATALNSVLRPGEQSFEVDPPAGAVVFHGQPAAKSPRYDLGRILTEAEIDAALPAFPCPDAPNPAFAGDAARRTLPERHPWIIRSVALLVALLLGGVAWRALRTYGTAS